MHVLGLSAFGSDAAAVLLRDGLVVAAAQEERFTRVARDPSFPRRAVRACLREGGIEAQALDWVVFHEKPLRRFERVLASQLRGFPRSGGSFARSMFTWLGDRLWLKNRIASELSVPLERVLFASHHESHAASAFLPSPFEDAAVLVADGAGEWATTTLWRGTGSRLQLLAELRFPHSLALFTSALAQHLGFAPGGGESRLMELAAFGQPRFRAEVDRLLRVGADGSFTLDMDAFRFDYDSGHLAAPALERALGPARVPGAPLRLAAPDSRDADLAASVQAAVHDALLALLAELRRRAPVDDLCLAGEAFLDPTAVGRIARDGPFRRVFVQPAAGDAGAALGAALHVHYAVLGGARAWRQETAALGERLPEEPGPGAVALPDDDAVLDMLLARLRRDGLVGWARGRFEWGPRALGQRSLLADPRRAEAR
jgi:carbamoyltransferase